MERSSGNNVASCITARGACIGPMPSPQTFDRAPLASAAP